MTDGLKFPEGPVARPDGTLLLTEMATGALVRVDTASGAAERLVECGGGPNGLAVGPGGSLYVCNNGGTEWRRSGDILRPGLPLPDDPAGSIQRVRCNASFVETFYASCADQPLSAPNDLVFDSTGGFWFTDTGKNRSRSRDHGGLYYASADGSSIIAVVYPLTTPNGVGLSPGERELYVAETLTGRLWAWPLSESFPAERFTTRTSPLPAAHITPIARHASDAAPTALPQALRQT